MNCKGNGEGHQNGATPQLGSSGLTTLDECIVNLAVNSKTGVLSLTDYFEPYNYITLDAGDLDLGTYVTRKDVTVLMAIGSGGIAMLDPAYFNGTGVSAMAIAVGKSGQVYVVNADNLGGYKLGSGQTNNVLQTLSLGKGVWGGCGSYPLEVSRTIQHLFTIIDKCQGGYIYCSPIGAATSVYKLGHDKNGAPEFSKAGQTPVTSAARIGVGVPTITSYKGQPGTGIMWLTVCSYLRSPTCAKIRRIPMLDSWLSPRFLDPTATSKDLRSLKRTVSANFNGLRLVTGGCT